MTKRLFAILAALGLVLTLAALALPVEAQDPVGGALATLAAATVQAQRYQAAQLATRQAQAVQATSQAQSAIATAQAQSAQATSQALDAQARQQAAQATAQASAYQATSQAGAMLAGSTATSQAQSAQATSQAYSVALASQSRQAQASEAFLYLALALAALTAGGLAWKAYKTIGSKASKPEATPSTATPSGDVVEGEYHFTPVGRGLGDFTIIEDDAMIDKFEQYLEENAL